MIRRIHVYIEYFFSNTLNKAYNIVIIIIKNIFKKVFLITSFLRQYIMKTIIIQTTIIIDEKIW